MMLGAYEGTRPICKNGHDKRIVGVSRRQCRQCRKEGRKDERRRASTKPRKPYYFVEVFCKRGHDKRVVGVDYNGSCAECRRLRVREQRRIEQENNPHSRRRAVPVPNLRRMRRELGISMPELAKATRYHFSYLYRLEAQETRASPEALARILSVIAPRLSEAKWEALL